MLTQELTIPICPDCGTRLEGGFSRNLGRCMICLLRVGFDDVEEPDETLFASVTDRLGNYRIERRGDGSLWELGHGAMGVTYRPLDTLSPLHRDRVPTAFHHHGARSGSYRVDPLRKKPGLR